MGDEKHFDAHYGTQQGMVGVILIFVKAFQVIGESKYRDFAESYLRSLPDRTVLTDFTLGNGLVGLGEIYLEAHKAFNNPVWLERATWIAQVLLHTFQIDTNDGGNWVTGRSTTITAGLFDGNAGLIHFLMHYLMPDQLHHPLSPGT